MLASSRAAKGASNVGQHVEKYAAEALEGSRSVLNDKHQVRAVALGFLGTVYSVRADLKKLEPVLIESVELSRFRWGNGNNVTAGGNASLGLLFILQGEYRKAEPYCRAALAYSIENTPESRDRFLLEVRVGVCLLAQRRFAESTANFLTAYKGDEGAGHEPFRPMHPTCAGSSNSASNYATTPASSLKTGH